MRLWSVHPGYLDRQGLLAVWREGLLARKVLAGATRGYRRHPQLERFRGHPYPGEAIDAYLHEIATEAARRGYSFDRSLIGPADPDLRMYVTSGQLRFEWEHLERKLAQRSPARAATNADVSEPWPHPIFRVMPGPVELWERGAT